MRNRDLLGTAVPPVGSRKRLVGWLRQGGGWLLGFAAVLVLLGIFGDTITPAWRYDRAYLAEGELWRIVTGHLVHADTGHLLLNLAGLGVIALLFPHEYSPGEWFLTGLAAALAVTAGLWWLNPEVGWYVGLSGVLHGALAAGAVAWWKSQSRPLALALSLLLVAKLAWEQWQGALTGAADLAVIVDAHLYGAGGGLLAGLALKAGRLYRKR